MGKDPFHQEGRLRRGSDPRVTVDIQELTSFVSSIQAAQFKSSHLIDNTPVGKIGSHKQDDALLKELPHDRPNKFSCKSPSMHGTLVS